MHFIAHGMSSYLFSISSFTAIDLSFYSNLYSVANKTQRQTKSKVIFLPFSFEERNPLSMGIIRFVVLLLEKGSHRRVDCFLLIIPTDPFTIKQILNHNLCLSFKDCRICCFGTGIIVDDSFISSGL